MISLKNYKKIALALLVCCSFAPTSSSSADLYEACREGHVEIVQLLVRHGANINIQNNNNGMTPLYVACWRGHSKIVQFLIQSGANVDIKTNEGWSPLHVACWKHVARWQHYLQHYLEIVQLLVHHGANINIQDNIDWTPLRHACQQGDSEIVQLLVRHGAIVTKSIKSSNPNITTYLNSICDAEQNFNVNTTQATPELLQRFIACGKHFSYIFNVFLQKAPQVQTMLLKHALLHNTNTFQALCACTNCDQLLTPQMLADNTYLQQKYAAYRKQLPPQKNANDWKTKTRLSKFADITLTFSK